MDSNLAVERQIDNETKMLLAQGITEGVARPSAAVVMDANLHFYTVF